MRVKNLTLAELEEKVIAIGFVDENLYTQVRIDCKELFDEHPDAIPSLAVHPPQGDAYPAVVTRDVDIVVWNVAKSDVQYANLGRLQLTFTIGEIVAKSYVGKYVIDKSIMPDGEAPTPIENWITEANAILGEIPGTITEAVDNALEEAKESGEFDGADGVSPMVNVTKTQDGHHVVITDTEGDHPFDVPDGEDGDPGHTPVITASRSGNTTTIMVDGVVIAQISDGREGDPGHSPVVTASKSGKVTTISVDGTPIATILDGEDGSGGDVIDDTAGPFTTDKTWSASKLWSDFAGKVNKTGAQFNDVSMNRVPNSTVGDKSIAIGTAQSAEQGAIASGDNSVAVGTYVQATGNKAIAIGDNAQASGSNSTAIGGMATASGNFSFSHGSSTSAQGINSTAEGYGTTASGICAHAGGSQTRAIGDYAHSQGYGGVANGYASSVEGNGTVANGANSSVSGMYNVPDSYENWPDWAPNTYYAAGAKVHLPDEVSDDPRGEYFVCNTPHTSGTAWVTYSFYWDSDNGKMNYAQIVGNGSNYLQQSNAFSLGWDGTGHFAGDVYVNCNSDGSGGVKLEPVVFATDAHTREIFATV